jgi:uncharacterized protein (DUF1800 family)
MSSHALSIEDARHLWSRTGFLNADFILNDYTDHTRREAIELTINSGAYTPPVTDLPEFDHELYLKIKSKNLSKKEKRKIRDPLVKQDRKKITNWWHREILSSNNAFQEKMVVFWHSHFAAIAFKVLPPYMLEQNQIFRKHSLGSFKELLYEVMHNPTIHQFLDNTQNTVKKPNENLARELLELYTMGEGDHYSEKDVRNMAKALSGLSDDYRTKKMKLSHKRKDHSYITIFGKTGTFGLDGAIELILNHPHTSKFITLKLWEEFISQDPSAEKLERLSKLFYESDYDIKFIISEILNSEEFWGQKNRNNLVKSPFDLIASSKIILNFPSSTLFNLPNQMKKSGQRLFHPPDVNGWLGGRRWINSDLIIARQILLNTYINKITKFYKKIGTDSSLLRVAVDRAENKKLQFFAIGESMSDDINMRYEDMRLKHIRKKIFSVLLDHRFNFK